MRIGMLPLAKKILRGKCGHKVFLRLILQQNTLSIMLKWFLIHTPRRHPLKKAKSLRPYLGVFHHYTGHCTGTIQTVYRHSQRGYSYHPSKYPPYLAGVSSLIPVHLSRT